MTLEPVFPDLDRVRDAVAPHTRVTPLLPSEWLSETAGTEVLLKCENLQVTGSFKIRGALAALELMDPGTRRAGVVTCSAGNHGLGLARAAALHGVPCRVVVPSTAPRVKTDGIEGEGAIVIRSPFPGYDPTLEWTRKQLAGWGGSFVSPFDDPAVMAGNGGTVLREILDREPDVDTVVAPCGGGGLTGGMGWAAKQLGQGVMIVGVNTDASPGMWLSRRDGRAHESIESAPTICEGIEGGVSEASYRLGLDLVHDVVAVPERTIRRAAGLLAARDHQMVEGSGAAGAAALLDGLVTGNKVAVVLTGSNIDPDLLARLVEEAAA